MVRSVTPFVSTRVPPWLDLKKVKARAEERGITEKEARDELFEENYDDEN